MALRDAVTDRQTQPGALAHGPRREERLEDPRQDVRRNPGPRVRHAHSDPAVRRHQADGDLGLSRPDQRLLRIEHQIQDDLLELCRIPANSRNALGNLADQPNALKAESILSQSKSSSDDIPHIDQCNVPWSRAPKGLQILDDLRRAHRPVENLLELSLEVLIGEATAQHLGVSGNDRERIVDLVRDAADELTERGELPGLQELLLRSLELTQARLELSVQASVLGGEDGPIGERLRQVHLVRREDASADVANLEGPDDRTTRAKRHRADGGTVCRAESVAEIRGHLEPRVG